MVTPYSAPKYGPRTLSVGAQRGNRIDAHRPPRRNEAGDNGGEHQRNRDAEVLGGQ